MHNILIISSSVRTGRKSNRIATYFQRFIQEKQLANVTMADLDEYNFPIFEERLKFLSDPPANLLEYAEKVKKADAVLIVTPEYNGGYPASIKNAIDVLIDEWHRKPVAISTVSAGPFGGMQVITSLQFSLWKIRALTVPAMFPVPSVEKNYDEAGVPADKEGTDKRAAAFLSELIWWAEAKKKNEA